MRRTLFRFMLIFLLLSPLPFGSNLPVTWNLCALITAFLTLFWALMSLRHSEKISLSLSPIFIMLFFVPCLWALLQTLSNMPADWLHPIWQLAGDILRHEGTGYISLNPDKTITALMRLMTYGLVFFLFFQYCREWKNARSLVFLLAVAGSLHALYGLVILWGDFKTIWWYQKTTSPYDVTSTFINKNTFATFAGLTLLCAVALFVDGLTKHIRRVNAQWLDKVSFIESIVTYSWRPLLGIMLISVALISSHSRGGVLSTGVAVILLLLIFAIKSKVRSKAMLFAIAGVISVTVYAYNISSNVLLQRMDKFSESAQERMDVYVNTLDAIRDNPWLGFGYGSFEEGYRLYHEEKIEGVVHKTHNTYLENIFGLGLPAALALFAVFIGLSGAIVAGVAGRHHDWLYPAIGAVATVQVAIHSLVDFSLQIPAVAITYAAILGMAVAQSVSPRRRRDS